MAIDFHKKSRSSTVMAAPIVGRKQWNYLPTCLFKIMLEYLPSNCVAIARVCKPWKIHCDRELSLRDRSISDRLFSNPSIGRKSVAVERLTKKLIPTAVFPCRAVHTMSTIGIYFGSRQTLMGDQLLAFHPTAVIEWNLNNSERPAIRRLGPTEINRPHDLLTIVKVCQFGNTFLLAKKDHIQIWDLTKIPTKSSDKKPIKSLNLLGEFVDCDLKDSCIVFVHKGFQGMVIHPNYRDVVTRFQPVASKDPITSIHILESTICTTSCSLSGENILTVWDRTTLQATHNVINPCYLLNVKELRLQQNQISILHQDRTLQVWNYMTGTLICGFTEVHSFYRCGNLMLISTGMESIYVFDIQKKTHICTLNGPSVTTPNPGARIHILCNPIEGTISTLTEGPMDMSVAIVRQWKITT